MNIKENEAFLVKLAYPNFDVTKSNVAFTSGSELVIPYMDRNDIIGYEHVRLNWYYMEFRDAQGAISHTDKIKIGYGPITDTYVIKSNSYLSTKMPVFVVG